METENSADRSEKSAENSEKSADKSEKSADKSEKSDDNAKQGVQQTSDGSAPNQTGNTTVVSPVFGNKPAEVTCGNCKTKVMTTTTTELGACAWLACVIVFCLCWPLFFIPLVMNSCKDVHHTCPECGSRLGTYKRL